MIESKKMKNPIPEWCKERDVLFPFFSVCVYWFQKLQIFGRQKRICISLLCMYYKKDIWRVRSRASTTKQVEPNRKTAKGAAHSIHVHTIIITNIIINQNYYLLYVI